MLSEQDIASHYLRNFYTLKATTASLKQQAYQIRYQVYFQEQKMISNDKVGNNYETDEWDDKAIHSLLFHRGTHQAIGNVRLILANHSSSGILPFEKHYTKKLDFSSTPISHLHEGTTGEVSRMSILSSFRRRPTDQQMDYEPSISKEDNDTRFPINYMPTCLTYSAINLMLEARLDYGVALMEPRLAKLLKRFGVVLMKIGEPQYLFGFRAPFLIFPEKTKQNLPDEYSGLFDLIAREIDHPKLSQQNTIYEDARKAQ